MDIILYVCCLDIDTSTVIVATASSYYYIHTLRLKTHRVKLRSIHWYSPFCCQGYFPHDWSVWFSWIPYVYVNYMHSLAKHSLLLICTVWYTYICINVYLYKAVAMVFVGVAVPLINIHSMLRTQVMYATLSESQNYGTHYSCKTTLIRIVIGMELKSK